MIVKSYIESACGAAEPTLRAYLKRGLSITTKDKLNVVPYGLVNQMKIQQLYK